jgi:serine/threonine protein phosphatase PrpC
MGTRARPTEDVACPTCGQPVGVWDGFCESCGTELTPPVVSTETPGYVAECPACAADPETANAGVTQDGYCESCGRKVPSGRDHAELDLGLLAGVTDRGQRHSRNEDAMALATARTPDGPVALAVVCDGVSTAPRPDEASLAAARAAVRVLLTSVRVGEDADEASLEAVRAASQTLSGVAGPDGAPACTYASAVVSRDAITACWLGDSRVYWLAADAGAEGGAGLSPWEQVTQPIEEQATRPAQAPRGSAASACLTRDDSLAAELVASGVLAEADAMASPQAHVITQWLGADFPDPQPHVIRFEPRGPGAVLVCTDGLWNYRPEAADLAALALPEGRTDPLRSVAALVKVANDAGGRDNITAVLVPFPPATP